MLFNNKINKKRLAPGLKLNPTLVIRNNVTTDDPDQDEPDKHAEIYNLLTFKDELATTLMTETYDNKKVTKPTLKALLFPAIMAPKLMRQNINTGKCMNKLF